VLAAGVQHRDLHSENFVRLRSGELAVLDLQSASPSAAAARFDRALRLATAARLVRDRQDPPAVLAGVPPVFGIFTGLPALVYAAFGTSRHAAVGPMSLPMNPVKSTMNAMIRNPINTVGMTMGSQPLENSTAQISAQQLNAPPVPAPTMPRPPRPFKW
jgi:hypothetical protein